MQEHEWFIRDQKRKDGGDAALKDVDGDHKPTTWTDLGIDPNDPHWPEHYSQKVVKEMQGMDVDASLAKAAQRKGIRYNKTR